MSTPEFNPNDQRTKINPEDLPPLEPTAEVPAVHSDKLNDPAYWSEKFEGKTAVVPKEHRDDRHKEKTKVSSWKKAAAAMGLLAATAAGVFGGAKALGGDTNTDLPRKESGNSASANPGETDGGILPGGPEGEPQADPNSEIFELNAKNFNNSEQLVGGTLTLMNGWHMGGATPETVENIDHSMTLDEYVQSVATPIDEAYIDAMVVDNWQADESLRSFVEAMKDEHRIFLKTYMGSMLDWSNKDNPYNYSESLDSYTEESETPDKITASYRYVAHDNFNDVPNASEFIAESQEGETGGNTMTWIKEGNVWKLADVEYNAG